MGLWETTIAGDSGVPGIKARSCVTPQSVQSAFARMPAGCTISNQTQTSTHAGGDVSCTFQNVQSSGHFDIEFPDSETVHTKTTLTMTTQGTTRTMTTEAIGKFISSDCGSVAPGKPQIVH